MDYGSSYLPSELCAAYLWAQLEQADKINDARLSVWNRYYEAFGPLSESGRAGLPLVPDGCTHNAHMFYIKCKDLEERTRFISCMKESGITCVFHYIPLHSSPAGKKFGRFFGEDRFTTKESERLVRLPLWYGMTDETVESVVCAVRGFWETQ